MAALALDAALAALILAALSLAVALVALESHQVPASSINVIAAGINVKKPSTLALKVAGACVLNGIVGIVGSVGCGILCESLD